jgi:hypothetical protein
MNQFTPRSHWRKGKDMGHWESSKCDYCTYAADMFYLGTYACFDHRTRLLVTKDLQNAYFDARALVKLAMPDGKRGLLAL